ncbi:MAG: hypothetical protein J5794_06975 [Lachnospiraceae bacterium]|nr:hypothetical protein [Lachnospiraceae bacterium]
MIKGLLTIVILILLAGAIALAAIKVKFRKVGIVLAAILALGLIFLPGSIHTVDTGEIAVVKHLGEARGTRSAGTYVDFWLTNVYQTYDAKVQGVNINTATYSSDAQTMDVAMTLQYQIMSDRVVEIAKQYGTLDLLEERIKAIAIEKTKAVLSSHKAMDIIANRSAMSPAVEGAIKGAVGEEYYVNIIAVVITNIDFSDAFETAVEDKMIAEQTKLKAEYENQTKIAQTEAQAKAKLIEAEANAKAELIKAEAEAKANELLEQSLTDKILRKLYLDKWDGVLPQTVAGENANILLSVGE